MHRSALALKIYKKEHGKYPANFAELVPDIIQEVPKDPYSGKDFIYKKQGNGFILYSVGRNIKDDGGKRKKEIYCDDITFKCTK